VRLVEMLFGTREGFEYRRCGACGVLWLDQPPHDLARYYPDSYYPDGHDAGLGPERRPSAFDRAVTSRRLFGTHRLRAGIARRIGGTIPPEAALVRPLVKAAGLRSLDDPILDVGSSPIPERLVQLSRVGFRRLLGIDPMAPHDLVYHGVPVQRRTIHEVEGRFALITFHHSFEHVPDPRETLLAASRLLRPGGTILIRMPVMGTWFWETYGTDWWELDPPRHLFVHSRESLGLLAKEAGLVVDRIDYDSTFLEIVASDQLARGIPWRDPRSYWSANDASERAEEITREIEAANATVARLNAEGRAGRAGYYLRASAAAGDATAVAAAAGTPRPSAA
jgi:SAM-dependent methyltransferase